ncbi:MAG: radical SAM protein [Candidatus Hadarchaeota archaeon]
MKRARPRSVVKTSAGSLLLGKMPRGCQLCIRGTKLVLFVTGLCRSGCFYCPLSEKRRWKDIVYANERQVKSSREITEEATMMGALGTGITGGDPIMRFNRALGHIRLMKKKFGRKHHIHMYCCTPLSTEKLRKLKKVGLDEIRFHLWSAKPVKLALDAGINAGVELPAIPGDYNKLVSFLKELDETPGVFVNLNELEFSDTNLKSFKKRGFRLRAETSMAVKGSQELALKILKWAATNTRLNIHYCPSSLKDSVQLKNRLKRRAVRVAKPYEQVTDEGLLFKGVITGVAPGRLASLRRRLIKRHGIDPKLLGLDIQKKRIELHWRLAQALSKVESALDFALVEEYPTHDRLETTMIPLAKSV